MKKKVLIITYYWPPSGGAGVQRWLKMSKYLAEMDVEVHVLSPNADVASYMQLDTSLVHEIPPNVYTHQTNSFEPLRLYAYLVGKENIPTAGFSNVNNRSIFQKIANFIRSNIFIPDPRIGWRSYAVRAAKKIIREKKISTIITTSPPHSTQMIGLRLKREMNVNWVVDLRDPWTDIYYYPILNHSLISHAINKRFERNVLLECDHIVTVTDGFKRIFQAKSSTLDEDKFSVIPNGYDEYDFKEIQPKMPDVFTITYTGTLSEVYEAESFFVALKSYITSHSSSPIRVRFVGTLAESLFEYAKKLEVAHCIERIPYVPHAESVRYLLESNMLLLVIPPPTHEAEVSGIVPGKLFEYLAARIPIICLSSSREEDAGKIIESCSAGYNFLHSESENIARFIHQIESGVPSTQELTFDPQQIQQFSRREQAKKIKSLIA